MVVCDDDREGFCMRQGYESARVNNCATRHAAQERGDDLDEMISDSPHDDF